MKRFLKRRVTVFGRSIPLALILAAVLVVGGLAAGWLALRTFNVTLTSMAWEVGPSYLKSDDDGVVDNLFDVGDLPGANDPSGPYITLDTPAARDNPDRASCTVAGGGGTGPFDITITDGYPDYFCSIEVVQASNVGADNAKLQGWTIIDPAADGVTLTHSFPACGTELTQDVATDLYMGFSVAADDLLYPGVVVPGHSIEYDWTPSTMFDAGLCP